MGTEKHSRRMDPTLVHPYSSACGGRIDIKTLIAAGPSLVGQEVNVAGWVKTGRFQENNTVVFLELNDGSTTANFQVLVKQETHDIKALQSTGTSVVVKGEIKAHPKREDEVEMHATAVLFVGECNADVKKGATFPLQKGKDKGKNPL